MHSQALIMLNFPVQEYGSCGYRSLAWPSSHRRMSYSPNRINSMCQDEMSNEAGYVAFGKNII